MSRQSVDFLVVGAGYVGARLARALASRATVATTNRQAATRHDPRLPGIAAHRVDLDAGDRLTHLPAADVVIYLVPPPPTGRTDPRLRHWLAHPGGWRRCVYVSTTGVYGSDDGSVIDECTAAQPDHDRGWRRLDAEAQLRAVTARRRQEWTILRVPGIYGPGRLGLERLRRGDPVLAEEDAGITNRIHVDDLVQALCLAATAPHAANRLYLLSDGAPCTSTEHLRRVAALAGLPGPVTCRLADAADRIAPDWLAQQRRGRAIDGRRIATELGFEPRYADPTEGIRASLAASER